MVLLMVIGMQLVSVLPPAHGAAGGRYSPPIFVLADHTAIACIERRGDCADSQRHGLAHCNKILMAVHVFRRHFNDESIVLWSLFHAG